MEERTTATDAPAAATPAPAAAAPAAPVRGPDEMPDNRSLLWSMTPEQRAAIYLNQIRKMLIFFVVLTVLGIIAGVIIGVVDINALHNAQQTTPTIGY